MLELNCYVQEHLLEFILKGEGIKEAINETQQISAIIGKSIITAKKRR